MSALAGNTALLSIDMQPRYLIDIPKTDRTALIQRHMELIKLCIRFNVLLVHVEFNSSRTWSYSGSTLDTLLDASESLGERRIHHFKSHQNAFYKDEGLALLAQLHKFGISHAVLTGVFARQCVLKSAFGARANSLRLTFDDTAIADQYSAWRDDVLPAYRALGRVAKLEDILAL